MKKYLCILVIVALVVLSFGQIVSAQASFVKVEISPAQVYIDGNLLKTQIISYNGRLYASLNDICKYFNYSYSLDETKNVINAVPANGTESPSQLPGINVNSWIKNGSFVAIMDPYDISFNGVSTFMESMVFKAEPFVPVRYFIEMFDKQVTWDKDQNSVIVNNYPEEVIGSVNGENVTQREFDYYYAPNIDQVKQQAQSTPGAKLEDAISKFKQQVFDFIVMRKVVMQNAKKNGISLNNDDLKDVSYSLNQMLYTDGGINGFRDVLASTGTVYKQAVTYYTENKLGTKLKASLVGGVQATDDEVSQYYDKNKSTYVVPEQIRAKHILLTAQKPDGSLDRDAALKKAQAVMAKLKAGEDFDKLMNEYSEDTGLKSNPDGYTFTRGQMVKPFEDAAFAMQPGQISDLVESQFGFHIIKVEERIPEKQQTLAELKDQLKSKLDADKQEAYFEGLVNSWVKDSTIVDNHQK